MLRGQELGERERKRVRSFTEENSCRESKEAYQTTAELVLQVFKGGYEKAPWRGLPYENIQRARVLAGKECKGRERIQISYDEEV